MKNYDQLTEVKPPATGTSLVNVGTTERILSVAGGVVLTALGLRKFNPANLAMAVAGGALLFRGVSGHCPVNLAIGRNTAYPGKANEVSLCTSLVIHKSREDVYNYWRNFENLPIFMEHLKKVVVTSDKTSYWEADFPGSFGNIAWTAEIIDDQYASKIAWRSVKGSMIDNSGEIIFKDPVNDVGTELDVTIIYRPPIGDIGKSVANLLNKPLEKMIYNDIHNFKDKIEAGVEYGIPQ